MDRFEQAQRRPPLGSEDVDVVVSDSHQRSRPARRAVPVGHVSHGGPREGVDRIIARLAGRQHGVVTRGQLVAAGIGAGAIDHRLASARLHRVHRGVYLVGHARPAPHALQMAAVLACGPGAVLSHRWAAVDWSMLGSADGPIDVTVPRRSWRRRGIRMHRSVSLDARDVRVRAGVPNTSPARTLLDIAEAVVLRKLE